MLKILVLLSGLLGTFAAGRALAEDRPPIEINVALRKSEIREHGPVTVIVTVRHPVERKVDITSFLVEDEWFSAKGVSEDPVSSVQKEVSEAPWMDSRYELVLPGKPAGLYVLPSITVRVGREVYRSRPLNYEVVKAKTSPVFYLEAFADPSTTLFPGQHTKLTYRIYFQENVELTREELPLLEAVGFQKVGDLRIRTYEKKAVQVQEIVQEVRAISPGVFRLGRSLIEGYVYGQDFLGYRVRQGPLLSAEAGPVVLVVEPFPRQKMPASFSGALGSFHLDVTLTSSRDVEVGEAVTLQIAVKGSGDWDTVYLFPDRLASAFSGTFRVSLLPTSIRATDSEKIFVLDVFPLSDKVTEVPSLEFSSFDPVSRNYLTARSSPIPLHVKSVERSESRVASTSVLQGDVVFAKSLAETFQPSSKQIGDNYPLSTSELKEPFLRLWNAVWVAPAGLVLVWLQWRLPTFLERRRKRRVKPLSRQLWDRACRQRSEVAVCWMLLSRALMTALQESGVVQEIPSSYELLPEEGITGEVRAFLASLERAVFTGQQTKIKDRELKKARVLMEKMR